MTGEKDAPAEMPGEREAHDLASRITDAIIDLVLVDGENVSASVLHPATDIIAEIIAPILAGKERDNRQLKLEVAEERETSRISIYGWRDKANEMGARALAAEAALAKAVEALALVSQHQSVMARLEPDAHNAVVEVLALRASAAVEGAGGENDG